MRAKPLFLVCALGCGEQKFVAVNAEPDVIITSHDDGDVVGEGQRTWFIAIVDDADDADFFAPNDLPETAFESISVALAEMRRSASP